MVKFELLPIDKAIEILHDELANYSTAATILVDKFCFFPGWFREIEDFLQFAQLPETTENNCPEISEELFCNTVQLIEQLPGIIVCYPYVEWTNIINALISLLNDYIGYQDTICKVRVIEEQTIRITQLREHLQHLANFIKFGCTTELLLSVMMSLINRVQNLDSNQPMTFELSKMYLDALGFKGKDDFIV